MSKKPEILAKDLLITSSILDSFAWFKEAPLSWKERATTDLTNSLKRIYTPPDPKVQRGIDFENRITRHLLGPRTQFIAANGKKLGIIWDECHGGLQQKVVKRIIEVEGQRICLYGRADIHYADPHRIVDIKTTGNWK